MADIKMGSTQEKILDTTATLFIKEGAEKITMEEIAKQAGVGRATIYRNFANRDELLVALLERESRAMAKVIQKKLDKSLSPGEYVIEGMVLAVEAISKNTLFDYVFRSGEIKINRLLFMSNKITNVGLEIMLPIVESANLRDMDIDFETLMEWILRMLISLVSIPSPRIKDKKSLRKLLHQTMLPVLVN